MTKFEVSNLDESDVVARIVKSLNEDEVSFDLEAASAKWRCTMTSTGFYLSFVIQLYSLTNGLVRKVQRRSGDGLAFMAFYRTFKNALLLEEASTVRSAGISIRPPALPAHLLESLPIIDEPLSKGLVDLIRTNVMELVLEGVQGISELTESEEDRQSMTMERENPGELVDILLNLVQTSFCVRTQTFAALALANLSEEELFRELLLKSSKVSVLLQLLDDDGSHADAHMRRSAGRVISNLAKFNGRQLMENASYAAY